MNAIEEVRDLFERRGSEAHFGEGVSILEHSLQTAWLAEQAGAGPHLMVAALLHDIGHRLRTRCQRTSRITAWMRGMRRSAKRGFARVSGPM